MQISSKKSIKIKDITTQSNKFTVLTNLDSSQIGPQQATKLSLPSFNATAFSKTQNRDFWLNYDNFLIMAKKNVIFPLIFMMSLKNIHNYQYTTTSLDYFFKTLFLRTYKMYFLFSILKTNFLKIVYQTRVFVF